MKLKKRLNWLICLTQNCKRKRPRNLWSKWKVDYKELSYRLQRLVTTPETAQIVL